MTHPTTSQSTRVAMDEDTLLGDFLELGRIYLEAQREQDLVDAFLARVVTHAPGCRLSLRLRDETDGSIRVHGAPPDSPRDPRRLSRDATTGIGELGEFEPADAFVSDFRDAPLGCDIALARDGKLLGVLSVAYEADAAPSAIALTRLRRFAEQLLDGIASRSERSETARLRLYAGSIVDRTNVPIAVVDGEGHVRLSNGALRNVLALDSTELAARTLLSVVSEGDRGRVASAHANALEGVPTSGVELLVRTKKGGEHRLLVDFEPIRLPSGEIDSVMIVARDVTRVRQLEDQISHADRLATLGQLAAGVVHELNNPLTSILVYTEYVLRKAEARESDDGEVEKLKRVLDAAERIQEFAKDLVTYARTERGVREPISVTQVLDQALAFCAPTLERGQVKISRTFASSLPPLSAVRGQLQQVFVNLITNAAHAVKPGTGQVHLTVRSSRPGWLEVRIEDDGPGVPEAQREEIFRPFVTTKESGEGTGLGLSIVRTLVERHGGTITVEDSPLGGASFVVRLPNRPISDHPTTILLPGE